MKEWETIQLYYACKLVAGYAFKSKDFGDYPDKVIKITHIVPPTVDMKNLTGVDLSQYERKKLIKYIAKQGDYVLAMTGATIGKMGRIEESEAYVNQRVLLFKNNPNVDKDYLFYVLQQNKFQQYILNHIDSESAQPNISAATVGKYDFLLPSLKIQNKIGKFLRLIDDKINVNNRINDNLQQQAFALFDRLMIEAVDTECQVSEIAYLNPKRPLAKNKVARCIDMSQLSTSGAFPSGWEMKPFTGGMRFTNGDTLLARITPCLENGKTAYIDFLDDEEIAFGSTEYIVLAPKEDIPPEYLYCLARYPAFVDYAVKNMNGSSGRQRVSADTIGQFVIPCPSETAIKDFGKVASALFMKMKNNSLENLKLSSLRDTILPKLMAGEIDVSNIQF